MRIKMQKNKTLHVHAGFHKTGTSAIQSYLFHHDLGRSHSYLHVGEENSSLIMLEAFKRDYINGPEYNGPELSSLEVKKYQDRAKEKLIAAIHNNDSKNVILSAESIGTYHLDEHEAVRDFFSDYFSDVRFYLYARPHKSRIESAFQEILKTNYRGLDEQFVLIFQRAIGNIDRIYGADQVIVKKYCSDSFIDGDVVTDFLNQLGLSRQNIPVTRKNTSLSLPAVQLLYIYRKYFPHINRKDKLIVERLLTLKGNRFCMHSELFSRLFFTKEGDLDWLKQRTGFSLEEDITQHDDFGIKSESSLIEITDQTKNWLRKQRRGWLGRRRRLGSSMESIAEAVRALAL